MNNQADRLQNRYQVEGCGYPIRQGLVTIDNGQPLDQAQRSLVSCYWCKGLAIHPVKCQACHVLYCGLNKKSVCDKCKRQKFKSCLQLAGQTINRDMFYQVNIRCFCRKERFRYTEFINHLIECPKRYKFINFQLDRDGGNDLPLMDKWTNIQLNIHLMTGKLVFQIEMDTYDLQRLERTRVQINPNRVLGLREQLDCRISTTLPPKYVWVVELENNNYSVYSDEIQDKIQKGYQQWNMLPPVQTPIQIQIRQTKYLVVKTAFSPFYKQINRTTNFGRPVHRVSL